MIRSERHSAIDFRDLNVLVVEDEPFSREVGAHLLRSFGCPIVREARNGEHAVEQLTTATRSFGLVVCDFRMPGITGLQLLKLIRVGLPGVARDIPFAMLTGHADKPIVGLAFKLDVDCYLTKPVTAVTMRNRITKVMTTDRSIKSPFDYQEIEVDGVTEPADGSRASPGIVVTPAESVQIGRGASQTAIAAPGQSSAPSSRAAGSARKTPLSRVPPGTVLAEPVITSRGQVLVPAGIALDKRTIDRLLDLAEFDPGVRKVTIE